MGYFGELKSYYGELGPVRFWAWFGGTILFILFVAAGQLWLSDKIGWPDSYGFHCERRCWMRHLIHSPKLLRGSSAYELALFAWLWAIPASCAGIVLYALLKRWIGKRRTKILPME